ncbi:Aldehyde dehydrogenase (plasmid) [Rhodovulum sp. P5]|nr:Aldehyde dehydrogenase [Rhodovulum sp. P5]
MNADRFYIDGAWVEPMGRDTMPITDPAEDSEIGTVTLGTAGMSIAR